MNEPHTLAARLREAAIPEPSTDETSVLLREAADAIERLTAEREAAQEALRRIIGMCETPPSCVCGRPKDLPAVIACARAALPYEPRTPGGA